ncbi:hypothetical protein HK405_002815 [Cladochytrium tenue]|nr:hypothetical protein HK405_002815 [Cladochytrium tenue]
MARRRPPDGSRISIASTPLPLLPLVAVAEVLKRLPRADVSHTARLVSRTWAAAAVPILYAAVQLRRAGVHLGGLDCDALVLRAHQECLEALCAPRSPLVHTVDVSIIDVPAEDAVPFLRALEVAGARPRRLRVVGGTITPDFIAGLAPILGRVTTLVLENHERQQFMKEFSGLFSEQLVALRLKTENAAYVGSFLMRNKQSLRVLQWIIHSDEVNKVLVDFLATRPSLRALHIEHVNPALQIAILDGCQGSLRSLYLSPTFRISTGVILSGCPMLTTLKINGLSIGNKIMFDHQAALRHVLDLAGLPAFYKLRNLSVRRAVYPIGDTMPSEQLQKIVEYCPNLETLELHALLESVAPLASLPRLRYLNISAMLFFCPGLLDDVVELLTRLRDGEERGTPPIVTRAFVHLIELPPQSLPFGVVLRGQRAEELRMAMPTEDRSGGLLRIVEHWYLLPSYF